jgi:phosphoribosylamine--glycine ligase
MKVLVVGGGGREHALCWALAKHHHEVLCAPGNAGIAKVARCVAVKTDELGKLADLADAEKVELVVVGPEAPLVAGLADLLIARGHAVFGCSRAAAELEGSKAFAKDFMKRHGIPTAAFGVFSDFAEAELFVDTAVERGAKKLVVKADGLAAGKGVLICEGAAESKAALRSLLDQRSLGAAGSRVVVEEFLEGREVSLMALCDGENVTPLAPAEDHKTVHEGDQGPMTGGMGTLSPTPVMDDLSVARAVREVLQPTARGMVADGRSFRGLLYAGLMLTAQGPKVLEFNCRFGDPETQPLMLRLKDDPAQLLHAVAVGKMPSRVHFSEQAAVCVVLAAGGYPGAYQTGTPIFGLDDVKDAVVFHAGTRQEGEQIVTNGGRVLGVTALGADLEEARRHAYAAVQKISFEGMHYRNDIGGRR